jgi:threonine/homoserine/homoserine lactone efflux protein
VTLLQALLSFALVAGLLTVVPGLDTALVLRSSIAKSRRYAFATAAGISTGAMIWGVAAAVGVSALLAASEFAYRMLTIAGAAGGRPGQPCPGLADGDRNQPAQP